MSSHFVENKTVYLHFKCKDMDKIDKKPVKMTQIEVLEPRNQLDKINKKLTPKQYKFVEELVYGEADNISGAEAARRAGISVKKARTRASLWQNSKLFPQIVRTIESRRLELRKQYEASKDTHLVKLARLRDGAEKNDQFSAAINAEIHRGKTAGLYIDRKAIITGSIDKMSREDVLKEIKDIKNKFIPLLSKKAKTELFGKKVEEED